MSRINKTLALILTVIVAMSFLTLLAIKPVNAQATKNENYTLVPGSTVLIGIQLQEGDQVNGSFTFSNFHYYPNIYIGGHGELITYSTSVKIEDPKDQTLYDFGNDTEGSFNFTALDSGTYNLPAFCSYIWGVENPIAPELSLTYSVTGTPMEINILSPLSQTYTQSNVSLIYTTSRVYDYSAYSLDGNQNVSLSGYGNSTLTGLSNGSHTITVYANDTFGNRDASQTVNFTVENPSSSTPTATIAEFPTSTILPFFYLCSALL